MGHGVSGPWVQDGIVRGIRTKAKLVGATTGVALHRGGADWSVSPLTLEARDQIRRRKRFPRFGADAARAALVEAPFASERPTEGGRSELSHEKNGGDDVPILLRWTLCCLSTYRAA